MFRIKHKHEVLRCAYDHCNRKLRGFGFVDENTGSIFCGEECALREANERAPKPLMVQ